MAANKNNSAQKSQNDPQSRQHKHQQQKTRQSAGSKKASHFPVAQHHEQELPETRMFR